MRYDHVPPRAERHEVNWDRMSSPGIYAPGKRRFFASLDLHPDLVEWLDGNAPGWSFRSDWDYSNAGLDDEGCHLLVSSREEAEGFIVVAAAMSAAWTEADRAAMRYTLVLEIPDAEPVELERSHHVPDGARHERTLGRHLVLNQQPMRARIYRAMREAGSTMGHDAADPDAPMRVDVRLEPDDVLVPGTRLALLRSGAARA